MFVPILYRFICVSSVIRKKTRPMRKVRCFKCNFNYPDSASISSRMLDESKR